jgi:hypothetical protein
LFITWDGQLGFSSDVWDYPVATSGTIEWNGQTTQGTEKVELQSITENACSNIERWVASAPERGAPFSRLYFSGAKTNPAELLFDVPYQGPFDFDAGASGISSADRIVEVTLEQGWRPYRQQSLSPAFWRSLDVVARDRIRFRTSLQGLYLELGAFFNFTWTRGALLGPYTSVLFQVESITLAPDDSVEIEASWRNDTATSRSYLLDDETLLVRSKGALTGSATTGTGNDVVTFGGTINLTTMGVQPGDILVLRDSSEATDSFARNACLRIDTVDSATQVTCVQLVVTGGVVVNADWSIVRGATTYPTAVSDPSNYPSGGSMYGKVTQAAGTTSDAAVGNALVNG